MNSTSRRSSSSEYQTEESLERITAHSTQDVSSFIGAKVTVKASSFVSKSGVISSAWIQILNNTLSIM